MPHQNTFLSGFITEADLVALEKRRQLLSRFARQREADARARIEALESELGRVALLARALADLCLSKGLMTKDELVRQLLDADPAAGKRSAGTDRARPGGKRKRRSSGP